VSEAEDDAPTLGYQSGETDGLRPQRRALPWLLFALSGGLGAALYGRNLDERQRQHRALSQARDESAELRHELFRTQAHLTASEKERKTKSTVADALEGALVKKSAESETSTKLIASLKAQLDAKDGEVSAQDNRITVNLVDEILFPSGEAELQPKGKQVLSRVGGVLKGLTDKQILIGGHTDDRPIHTERFPSNWELSAARAVNVVHYLSDTVGVDPHNLTAAGFSEFHPRGNDRAQNRRIEILLTPRIGEKAVERPAEKPAATKAR
jgi:chemotaxis protein MotB